MSDRSSFFARNKAIIAVVAVAGVSAGAYYYYNALQAQADSSDETSASDASKKKKSKKKSKKKADSTKKSPASTAEHHKDLWPLKDGLPDISDELILSLSETQKSEWAAALKEDGNEEFKTQQYDKAIQFYTDALRLKIDPVFYSNRSACYAALNDHEAVIRDTTEAIKLKPDYTKCVLRRASSYEILENFPDAMFDLTALTIYGGFNNKPVENLLERVLRKHSMKIVEENLENRVPELPSASTICSFFGAFLKETSPEGILAESESAGDKYLFDAIKNLNLSTPEGYDNCDTLTNQAVSAYEVDSLTPESENAAKASIALEYSAAMSFLKNDPTKAAEEIEKAVSLKPRPRTYVFRALINADKSSFAQALEDFEQAKKLDPKFPDTYYHLGQLYYLTGDNDKAYENFEKAKELNPENVFANIQMACIKYKTGSRQEAEDMFTAAKLKFPTSPEIPNYYGEILADLGEIEPACKQFDTAARLQQALPTFTVGALPLINKALFISREGLEHLSEAEELLTQACELDSKLELARISLAQIKLQKEELDDAITLFEESLNLARTVEEKVQATSFAEATKMQKRIKSDPVLGPKIQQARNAYL